MLLLKEWENTHTHLKWIEDCEFESGVMEGIVINLDSESVKSDNFDE